MPIVYLNLVVSNSMQIVDNVAAGLGKRIWHQAGRIEEAMVHALDDVQLALDIIAHKLITVQSRMVHGNFVAIYVALDVEFFFGDVFDEHRAVGELRLFAAHVANYVEVGAEDRARIRAR